MANYWFLNILDIKRFVGSKLDAATAFSGIEPFIAQAEEEYLLPKTGRLFWADMDSIYDAMPVEDKGNVDDAKEFYRKALAWFTLAEYARITLRASENGLMRHYTDHTSTGSEPLMERTILEYLRNGYAAMEVFLVSVELRGVYFWSGYVNTDEFKQNNTCLIRNARDFSSAASRKIDRFAFEHLLALSIDVEQLMLSQFLPKDYYAWLLDIQFPAPNVNIDFGASKGFIALLKKAIAAITLDFAAQQNMICFEGGAIKVKDGYNPSALDGHRHYQKIKKNTFLGRARAYAIENKTGMLPIWSVADGGTNLNADAWVMEKEQEKDCRDNRGGRKIFVL